MNLSDCIVAASAATPIFRAPESAEGIRIGSLHYDSRTVVPGGLFFALPGEKADGASFVQDARNRGAVAVVSESKVTADIPVLVTADARAAMSAVSAAFFGEPSRRLTIAGVTGTNGKTTVTWMLEKIFEAAGLSAGIMGTIGSRVAGRFTASSMTTPEAPDLHGALREMADTGATHAALEVSSHAVSMKRVSHLFVDAAIFTNITRDHLDFHPDMDAYFESKARFIQENRKPGGTAVLCGDDPRVASLAGRLSGPVLLAGLSEGCRVRAETAAFGRHGFSALVRHPGGSFDLSAQLAGRHNLQNALCAVAAALSMGISPEAVSKGLSTLASVPGRLERVPWNGAFQVFVDYAHTPDALENVLSALIPITPGRLIVVFGCGGNRDREKRPIMGEAAGRLADFTVVTSDNPRFEDPMTIIDAIVPGVKEGLTRHRSKNGNRPDFAVEPDRDAAIRLAVSFARPGDTVLIAGKGHETYQIARGRTLSFDDRERAAAALAQIRQ